MSIVENSVLFIGEPCLGQWVGEEEFPRLKGQEVKPMIKEEDILGARSVFTRECKERAVELALNTNRKHSEIAQDLGINQNMLTRWKREMKQRETGPMKAFTGRGNARDEQTARLRKENAGLRETNEILKKAFVHLHGRESPVAAYLFMHRYQGRYPVTKMARELGVSRSTYYARLIRKPGRYEHRPGVLEAYQPDK